jgi:hypothetical protein
MVRSRTRVLIATLVLLAGGMTFVEPYAAKAESPPSNFPPIGLPFAAGAKAVLTAGPHQNNYHQCTSSDPCNSLDFGPVSPATSFHVTAAGPGVVQGGLGNCTSALVFIRHTTAGAFNGWWTGYYHLANIQVTPGQTVSAGTWIGDLAQTRPQAVPCGGSWDPCCPHVHYSVKYAPPSCDRSCIGDAFKTTAYDVSLGGVVLAGWQIASTSINSCMTYVATGEKRCPPSGQVTNYGGSVKTMAFFHAATSQGLSGCATGGGAFTGCWGTGWGVASGSPAAAVLPNGAALSFFNGGGTRGLSACATGGGAFSGCWSTGWTVASGSSPAVTVLPNGAALAFFNGGGTRGLSTCTTGGGAFSGCWSTGWPVAAGSPAAAVLPNGAALAFFNGGSTRGLSACTTGGGAFSGCWSTGRAVASGSPAAKALPNGEALAFFNGGGTSGLSECATTGAAFSGCWTTGWTVASASNPAVI